VGIRVSFYRPIPIGGPETDSRHRPRALALVSPHGRFAHLALTVTIPCTLSVVQPNLSHLLLLASSIMSSGHSNSPRRRGGRGRGTDPSGNRGRGRGMGPSGNRGRGRGDAPPIDRAGTPRGVCRLYWSAGSCDREFDCTFQHQAKNPVSSSAAQPTDYTPDFFSLEGLATNNGSSVDPQHTLSPSEAHNHLKPFLRDNFAFRDAFHVEGFARILASVNSRNRAWVRKTETNDDVY